MDLTAFAIDIADVLKVGVIVLSAGGGIWVVRRAIRLVG